MKDSLKYGLIAVGVLALAFVAYQKYSDSDGVSPKERVSAKKELQGNTGAEDKVKVNDKLDASKAKDKVKPLISNNGPMTSLQFEEMNYNFGEIEQESSNTYVFKFTNTGTEPLVISDAKGSCGCTVPEYPKYPIEPGKTDEITVVYKPTKAQKGAQEKSVTITANTQPATTVLKIAATVNAL